MRRLAQALVGLFPRRRRRLWRYVSPRRRGAGVFLLALLLTATYAYWILTNDGRIRREAQRYLAALTGCRVKIGEARFSFFGPVKLERVRVYMHGALSNHPFFQAETVMLRHDPWRLLATRTIHPREIVCIEPVLTFEQDESGQDKGRQKLMSMAAQSRKHPGAGRRGPLPRIRLRRGKWQAVKVSPPGRGGAGKSSPAVADMPVNVSMMPRGPHQYVIQFEERHDGKRVETQGKLTLDLRTGTWSVTGYAPSLPRLRPLLPVKYRKWLRKYAIDTGFHINGQAGTPGAKDTVFKVKLENLSMTLPASEGGVKLTDVCGTIVFREDKVHLKEITGRPVVNNVSAPEPGVPQTKLRLSGEYLGYEPTSDFHVALEVENVRFPSDLEAQGELGKAMRWLQHEYEPHGFVDLSIHYERKGGGLPEYRGTARPKGIRGTYCWFRYPLTDVSGRIEFTAKEAKLVNLTGRHGAARLAVNGTVQMKGRAYDVTVQADPGQFDEQLRAALPRRFRSVWDAVHPGGLAAASVHVSKESRDHPDKVELEMTMDGQATMTYHKFPYPLEGIVGHVRVAGDTVQINRLVARRGQMRCTIAGGRITGLGTKRPGVDVVIEATDVPLDQTLQQAVGANARRALAALRATGRAERVSAKLHQEPGQPLQHDIRAWLRDVTFKPDAFGYEVTGASGVLVVTPESATVKALRGRHGESTVTIRDSVFLLGERLGLDLRVEGSDVRLDESLYAAVPPKAQAIWRTLSPVGVADMNLRLVSNMPPHPGKLDWRLGLRAKGMAVTYEKFPYPFQGVMGQAVITPDLVEFADLTTRSGPMQARVGGSVRTGKQGSSVVLKVHATKVPVDDKLLKALPEELALVAKRVKTGGTCDVDFERLTFQTRPDREGESRTATGPAAPGPSGPDPTTAPAKPTWHAAGKIRLDGVSADLGVGYKSLTGTISGAAGMKPEGLALQADIQLDSVALGSKKLTRLSGQLVKSPASQVIQVKDLAAKAHGGRMSGFARIRGPEPFHYALSIFLEQVDLGDLLNAGVTDPKKRTDVRGLLTGDIKLRGKAGAGASKDGAGTLRITKAKLYKLPVLLGALHVVMLVLPVPRETAFTEGHVLYQIRGRKLIFREIHLTGPVLALIGSGTMDLKSEKVRLTFLSGRPGKVPRMASLPDTLLGLADELLKVLLNELVQIDITGTLKKPIMQTVPLRSLNSVIVKLTNPERQVD